MNRKILEDVKVNHVKRPPVSLKEEIAFVDTDNHNPTPHHLDKDTDNSSKYEFLNKKNHKSSESVKRIPSTPEMPRSRPPISKMILFILIVSLFIGIIYLLSTVFLRANVTITAKDKTFELKHQKFTAGKTSGKNVPFEIMIVTDSDSKDVVLTNSKEVSEKAKGEITIYNEYSTKVVKLTAGTYLSDEKGITYKTDSSVSVPGFTLDKARKVIPGQISVKITSFLPGEMYNGNPKSFSINSYKGTDKYKKVYGKAKTSMDGGMVGLVYLLGEEEKNEVLSKNSTLKDKLMRKLSAQVPSGYILYPDAINFESNLGENISSKNPNTKIELKGTLSAVLLDEEQLSNLIIDKLLPDISSDEKLEIIKPDLSVLSFNFTDISNTITKDKESFDFELSGDLPIKWMPNIEKLKGSLVNKNKAEVPQIFKKDPGILSAKVKIMPFWSKILPKDNKNINIIVQ